MTNVFNYKEGNMPRNDQIKKLGFFYRLLCGFIAFFCFMALIGIFAFGRDEGIHAQMVIFVAVIGLFFHASMVVMLTGYPPSYLKWASGKK